MAEHPVIGYVVWAARFGALLAKKGLALSHIGGVPTLSDAFRAINAKPVRPWRAVRAVALVRLAHVWPRLALPAVRLT